MAATITFFGPDATSKITAVDATGVEVANFTIESTHKSSLTILRHVAPNAPPVMVCTGHKISLSEVIRMNVHGQEVKFTTQGGLPLIYYVLETPMLGKLTWKSSSGETYEVVDSVKRVVAHADLSEMKFSVLMPGDEPMLDCLLAGWVALVQTKKRKAESSKQVKLAFEIIGQLAGGVGGAGG